MVRTGARARSLQHLLLRGGLRSVPARPRPPRLEDLPPDAAAHILELFSYLGGRYGSSRLQPGPWDLAFENGLVVELDEQLHFNRYRARALRADWTEPLPWRGAYLVYCRDRERNCLADGRWGQRWTTPSCERLFGPADPSGTFNQGGSPRWKQRALYDALKDMSALVGSVKLARLAIYDVVDGIELHSALEGQTEIDPGALVSFTCSRTAWA